MAMSESSSSSRRRPALDPAAVADNSESKKKPVVKQESQIEPSRLAGMALPPSLHEDEDPRKCTYRDFSRVPPPKPTPRSNHSKDPTFPMKLHMMLSTPEFSHIITWLPHGRSWRILKQADFEEQIIPRFFRHGRYSSFARQVNGWGFRRITQGDDWNSYYHELFLRGMPHLCQRMKRLTSKDDGARRKAQEERIPDLAAISLVSPVPDGPMGAAVAAAAVPRGLLPGRNPIMMGNGMDPTFLARAQMQMQMQMMNQPPSAYLLQQLQNNQNPRMAAAYPPPQGMQPPPGFLQQFAPGQPPPPPNNLDAMRQLLARSTNIEDLNNLAAMMGNNNNNQAQAGQQQQQQQQQQGMPPNPYGNNLSTLR